MEKEDIAMFEMPEIKVVRFNVEDVITTSPTGSIGGDSQFGGGDEE